MTYDFKKTYWCSNGRYEKEYQDLYSSLVPARGMATTTNGEVLRCASNIYYDAYNNGGGNFDVRYQEWQFIKYWINSVGLTVDIELIDEAFEAAQTTEYALLLENCSPDVPIWGQLENMLDAIIFILSPMVV